MAYILEPEVAGGWGEGTIADTLLHPPMVTKLVYQFDGWDGDDLLTSFPCYIVTKQLAQLISSASLSGYKFAPVTISKSEEFEELYPKRELPEFVWLQIYGSLGTSDFAMNQEHLLTVSEKAFNIIKQTNISHCEVIHCESNPDTRKAQ